MIFHRMYVHGSQLTIWTVFGSDFMWTWMARQYAMR